MRTLNETVSAIVNLEKQLDVKNPHRASELAVEISILLGELVEPISGYETDYMLLRSEKYHENLERMKPTPAKDALDFDPELVKLRVQIEKLKDFQRSRERTVNRIENHLRNIGNMERRGV